MKPSINFYNDLVNEEWSVSGIEKEYPMVAAVLPPDFGIYQYITKFMVQLFQHLDKNKIFFVRDHNKVVDLLKGNTNVSLCNIDHHHDVGYEDVTPLTIIRFPDVGDWVKYLKDEKIVSSYTWIHNPNSEFPDEGLNIYLNKDYELQQVNLDLFTDQVDMLIICNSPEWIPALYQPLFDTWVSMAEAWYKTEFEVL